MQWLFNSCKGLTRTRINAFPSSSRSYSSGEIPARRNWGTRAGPSTPTNSVKAQLDRLTPSNHRSLDRHPPSSSNRRPSPPPRVLSAEDLEIEAEDGYRPKSTASVNTSPVPMQYLRHRQAMKEAFPDGWSPQRKLSREAMDGLRTLHKHDPETFTTSVLSNRFKISPEAVRRILKSNWMPDEKRKNEMALKEMKMRETWREKRREEERARKLAKNRFPKEMLMDAESDKYFLDPEVAKLDEEQATNQATETPSSSSSSSPNSNHSTYSPTTPRSSLSP